METSAGERTYELKQINRKQQRKEILQYDCSQRKTQLPQTFQAKLS